jgi:hypothetical protein
MAARNGPDRPRVALIEVTPETLQRLRDPRVVLAIVAALVGGAAVLFGYIGISGTLDPGKQMPYLISGGVGGLFLLGLGAALLFSSDLGALRTDLREINDRLDTMAEDIGRLTSLVEETQARRGRR